MSLHAREQVRAMQCAKDVPPNTIAVRKRRAAKQQTIARAGTDAPLAFSPRYAAPEVLRAYEAGARTIPVTAALDTWSLGVMAYELLTDGPAFDRFSTPEEVTDQLVGRAPLPWEDGATRDGKLRKLRMLKRSLTQCLSREPRERPSAAELLDGWERLFDTFGGDATVAPTASTAATLASDRDGKLGGEDGAAALRGPGVAAPPDPRVVEGVPEAVSATNDTQSSGTQ